MLLTSSARCGGSFFWKSPSNRRLPTCPGTGASSQLDRPEENSQANKCCLPAPRRYRAYNNRSIARVPTAPAASPRPTAPSGVPAVFRLVSSQDLIGTVQDWFTAVLLSQARELLVPALTSSFRVLLDWLVHDGAGLAAGTSWPVSAALAALELHRILTRAWSRSGRAGSSGAVRRRSGTGSALCRSRRRRAACRSRRPPPSPRRRPARRSCSRSPRLPA